MTNRKKFKDTTVGKVIGSLGKAADSVLTGGKLSGVIDSIMGNTAMTPEEKKLAIDKLGLELKDKANAREMHARVQESENASWLAKNIAPIIAFIIIAAFVLVYVGPMVGLTAVSEMAVQGMTNVVLLVIGFYFGSSDKLLK